MPEQTTPRTIQSLMPLDGEELQTIQTGETGATETYATTQTPVSAPPPQQEQPKSTPWFIFLLYAAMFGGMYFLFLRPQRKREKEARELQAAITVGNEIVTTSGLFGKVVEVGEDCFIVEFGTNRGVRIPIIKSDVASIRAPKLTQSFTKAD
ncbi:MAG: preprotein translocase subunit YajC [Defluviitaleaceae bacterium]|nr:preprotein translocase subunit YajC [Defluviitaleaceae bacterium]